MTKAVPMTFEIATVLETGSHGCPPDAVALSRRATQWKRLSAEFVR